MSLGMKLISLRKSKNEKQEDVASAIGIAQKTISKWECNKSVPKPEYILKLAEHFNVDPSYFDDEINKEISEKPISKERNLLIVNLLEQLVTNGVIDDINSIDQTILDLIVNTAKVDLKNLMK